VATQDGERRDPGLKDTIPLGLKEGEPVGGFSRRWAAGSEALGLKDVSRLGYLERQADVEPLVGGQLVAGLRS
jgi:hypothetical protein